MGRFHKNNFQVNLNLNIRGLEQSTTLLINEKSRELQKKGKKIYKLGLGQSPFPVPEIVVESLRQNAHQKDYLPVRGLPQLREAVAEYNWREHKIKSNPDDILIGPGSKELIFLLQLVYYGDLIIPTPSWVSYSPQARIIGRNVQWVQTGYGDNWRLNPERLDLICRTDPSKPRIVIINYPANPTGYTYPLERLKELAKAARKYNVILISDEIYGMIHHTGQHVSIARFYPEGTIVSSGLSKWCGAGGWRLGTFSFPENLRWLLDAMATVASETFTATSAPIQYAAVTAFKMGNEMNEYLYFTRKILREIAKYLVHKLKEMNIDLQLPQGAFYLFPNFEFYREKLQKTGIYTSNELCNTILSKLNIAMLPGSDFGRPPEELTVRIAYVDFDGKKALESSKKYGHNGTNGTMNGTFIRENCQPLVKAFDLLGNWLADL